MSGPHGIMILLHELAMKIAPPGNIDAMPLGEKQPIAKSKPLHFALLDELHESLGHRVLADPSADLLPGCTL